MKLFEAIEILREAGIESADYDAREIFRHLSRDRGIGYIMKHLECENEELERAVMRRAKREPLQYILGSVGFYREDYTVNESVLIPRADTEHLVDYAVRHIPEGERFIDICTGSGCIAISTLNNTKGTTALAIDISPAALDVAKQNAEKIGVSERLTLRECDILTVPDLGEAVYAVLSNPPYVSESAYASLEPEIYREPKAAFVGGEDGGDFYRALVPYAKKLIKPEGFIAFEIGYDQKELISSLAEENGLDIELIKDYSDNWRVAVLRFPWSEQA